MWRTLYSGWRSLLIPFAAFLFLGCTIPQTYSSIQHRALTLQPQDLERYGLAFITPSTVTGTSDVSAPNSPRSSAALARAALGFVPTSWSCISFVSARRGLRAGAGAP